jgi:outer membrane protein OmpA-like peptidoglycan-associated protein
MKSTMRMQVTGWLAAVVIMFVLAAGASAQIDPKEKAKDKTLDRTDQKVDQGIDKGLDKIENGVGNLFKKKDKDKPEAAEEKETEENGEQGEVDETPEGEQPGGAKPQDPLITYSKYDFVPGDKVIFFEDFSQDNVGDFPALWFTNKGGEVMTTNKYPGKWFRMNEDGMYYLEKGCKFPENFTLEFDVIPLGAEDDAESAGLEMTLLSSDEEGLFPVMYVPGKAGVVLYFSTLGGSHSYSGYENQNYSGIAGEYGKEKGLLTYGELNHVAVWVQKTRLRVYIHGDKVFDVPKALAAGYQYDQIRFKIDDYSAPLISSIRVAEAGGDTRSKLLTEGKLISYGIYFDSGSDKVKPESYGTLKSIATVLTENPTVRIRITGHTDSDGDEAMNLDLSKRRAQAVKASLNQEFGIDEGRMEADGKGESAPLAPNTTPEGKAANRRVEFVKL